MQGCDVYEHVSAQDGCVRGARVTPGLAGSGLSAVFMSPADEARAR